MSPGPNDARGAIPEPFPLNPPVRTYGRKRTTIQANILPILRENPTARVARNINVRIPVQRQKSLLTESNVSNAEADDSTQRVDNWLANEGGADLLEPCDDYEPPEFSYETRAPHSSDDEEEEEGARSHITPPASLTSLEKKHLSKSPQYRAKSIKRRPYLIIRESYPPRGYKKLKPRPDPGKTEVGGKRRLDDGFSEGEAKASGLFKVMKKRKLPPPVDQTFGTLEMTQSTQGAQARLPKQRTRRSEDISFDLPKGKIHSSGHRNSSVDKRDQRATPKPRGAPVAGAVHFTHLTPEPATVVEEAPKVPQADARREKTQAMARESNTDGGRASVNRDSTELDFNAILGDDVIPSNEVPSTIPTSGQTTLVASPNSTNRTVVLGTSPSRSRSNSMQPSPSVWYGVVDAGVQTTQRLFQRVRTM